MGCHCDDRDSFLCLVVRVLDRDAVLYVVLICIKVPAHKVDSHDAAGKDRENFFFFIPKKDGEAVFLQRF